MATFASGFIVGFTAVWQLALVTIAVVPLIAVIGGIHTTTLSKLSNKSQESLSQAGNIVEQVECTDPKNKKKSFSFFFLDPVIKIMSLHLGFVLFGFVLSRQWYRSG